MVRINIRYLEDLKRKFVRGLKMIFEFPSRLVGLRAYVRLKKSQSQEFEVGDWVRLRARKPTGARTEIRVGPLAEKHFHESELGKPGANGSRELIQAPEGYGSDVHSFFKAREPWKVVEVHIRLGITAYLFYNRPPRHAAGLVIENDKVIYGEKRQFIDGSMVDKA
jgi:hypothetical protein